MSEWQDIATAPKDGTPVLVWFNGDYYVARYSPLWVPENLRWLVRHPSWSGTRPVSEISPTAYQEQCGMRGPTAWCALPSPPEGA